MSRDKQQRFQQIADDYKVVIAKVCSVYASASAPFADLYQEVMLNLWIGLDSFRGEAKVSTWIYRLALNTCINWHRRNRRHQGLTSLETGADIPAPVDDASEGIQELYRLIEHLAPIEKALITLWLDEKPYDEIAAILGISKANVATKLHRIRTRLSQMASNL
ncbi:MAG: sigma-70 family RNA polymerase sigma factor [Muribaculaceae bacterium]|nr:sigma-70 family RNA polymerase sigma factor [Muribaculaceae bacterium]